MKLFRMRDSDWTVEVEPEAWLLTPFKKILDRDKSKGKVISHKEMAFVYFYADMKSDYSIITSKSERISEIKKDLQLPDNWTMDSVIEDACTFYTSRSVTVLGRLYLNSIKAVNDISEYLYHTDALLAERDERGKPVNDINKITASIKLVKGLMQDLKAAEKEVLKEQEELSGRTKGSKTLALFEDGLNIED